MVRFVALFSIIVLSLTLSTPANAQFGGLLDKAKKQVGKELKNAVNKNSNGDFRMVLKAQKELNRLGYPVELTGEYSPETRTAILQFQRDTGRKETGNVKKKLIQAFMKAKPRPAPSGYQAANQQANTPAAQNSRSNVASAAAPETKAKPAKSGFKIPDVLAGSRRAKPRYPDPTPFQVDPAQSEVYYTPGELYVSKILPLRFRPDWYTDKMLTFETLDQIGKDQDTYKGFGARGGRFLFYKRAQVEGRSPKFIAGALEEEYKTRLMKAATHAPTKFYSEIVLDTDDLKYDFDTQKIYSHRGEKPSPGEGEAPYLLAGVERLGGPKEYGEGKKMTWRADLDTPYIYYEFAKSRARGSPIKLDVPRSFGLARRSHRVGSHIGIREELVIAALSMPPVAAEKFLLSKGEVRIRVEGEITGIVPTKSIRYKKAYVGELHRVTVTDPYGKIVKEYNPKDFAKFGQPVLPSETASVPDAPADASSEPSAVQGVAAVRRKRNPRTMRQHGYRMSQFIFGSDLLKFKFRPELLTAERLRLTTLKTVQKDQSMWAASRHAVNADTDEEAEILKAERMFFHPSQVAGRKAEFIAPALEQSLKRRLLQLAKGAPTKYKARYVFKPDMFDYNFETGTLYKKYKNNRSETRFFLSMRAFGGSIKNSDGSYVKTGDSTLVNSKAKSGFAYYSPKFTDFDIQPRRPRNKRNVRCWPHCPLRQDHFERHGDMAISDDKSAKFDRRGLVLNQRLEFLALKMSPADAERFLLGKEMVVVTIEGEITGIMGAGLKEDLYRYTGDLHRLTVTDTNGEMIKDLGPDDFENVATE